MALIGRGRPAPLTAEADARRREINSLERMSLGWAWNDAKNAARLAVELLRWATPASKWVASDAPEVAELDARMNAEAPVGGDPYRTRGEQRVNADPPEVTDARFEIANLLTYLTMFGEGSPITAPTGVGRDDEDPRTKLYWYAETMGKNIEQACVHAGAATRDVDERNRWAWAGHAAKGATEFIRKFATGNP